MTGQLRAGVATAALFARAALAVLAGLAGFAAFAAGSVRTVGAMLAVGALLAVGAMPRAAMAQPEPVEPAAAAAAAAAKAPAKDPKAAKRWLAVGQTLMQRGAYLAARNRPDDARQQFENAATAFHKAIEAGDDLAVYVELAAAEDRAGKPDAAVRHLRLLARLVRAPGALGARPDVAKRAAARLDELLPRVGLITLRVAPPGTSITLGGSELGSSPLAEPLVLMPGTYTLAFQADGYQPKEAELRVEPGTESERAIELEPVKMIVEPVQPPVPEEVPRVEPAPPPRPSRLPLYAGAALTVAAIGGASTLGALAIREHAVFTRRTTAPVAREDARANGRLLAQLTDVAIVTAVAAAGFTAYWYFYRYKRRLDNSAADRTGNPTAGLRARHAVSRQTKVDVVPWVQPQLGGVTLAGRF